MNITQVVLVASLAIVTAENTEFRVGNRVFNLPQSVRGNDLMLWNSFGAFIQKHNRDYNTAEEVLKRFEIYKDNMEVAKMWQKNELGTAEYGETQYSDLTPEEFKNTMHPNRWPIEGIRQYVDIKHYGVSNLVETPKSIDWRKKGAVTEVKNQGSCGSCWAFSTIGNIEGAWAIAKGKLISLSEQLLVDCDNVDQGCNGGLPIDACKEISRMGGLETEDQYPYDAVSEKCKLTKKDFVVYINDSVLLPNNENKMADWIAQKGPISVGVNASPLQYYRHGISYPWRFSCSPSGIDHAVLIVGYGVEGSKPYWIIKNSWGPEWGEDGFFRLYRGKNVCGINVMPSSAIIH